MAHLQIFPRPCSPAFPGEISGRMMRGREPRCSSQGPARPSCPVLARAAALSILSQELRPQGPLCAGPGLRASCRVGTWWSWALCVPPRTGVQCYPRLTRETGPARKPTRLGAPGRWGIEGTPNQGILVSKALLHGVHSAHSPAVGQARPRRAQSILLPLGQRLSRSQPRSTRGQHWAVLTIPSPLF